MPRFLKIKIDGSGSCEPISPATPGGEPADGLTGAPSIAGFLALGVPVFTWLDDEYWVVTGANDLTRLEEWCQDHKVDAAGRQRIEAQITRKEGTYAACRATFHPDIALHSATPPYALIIKTKRALLHVSRLWATWEEAIIDDTKPWSVQVGIDYGQIRGNNVVSVYLQRRASSGSTGAYNAARATYDAVDGENPPHRPWPSTGDLGLWPWKTGAGSYGVSGYAVPYADAGKADSTALVLGPKEEVLKITYALGGATIDGDAEPLQTHVEFSPIPSTDLPNMLRRADHEFARGLIPDPASGYGYALRWDGYWEGDTGPWRMGDYSQTRDGRSVKAFIKIGRQTGTIEAVKSALGSPSTDPLVIGHAVPYSDGSRWQQSDTGANAAIPFVDGSVKTALLPPDAGVQVPFLLHFAEVAWVDEMMVTVRVFTGSGRRATPTRCDEVETVEVSLADTPVTYGATVSGSGLSIELINGVYTLVVQLEEYLKSHYDSSIGADVWGLEQQVDIVATIKLVKGAKSGTFGVTRIGEEPVTDFDTFSGYGYYAHDPTLDPDA